MVPLPPQQDGRTSIRTEGTVTVPTDGTEDRRSKDDRRKDCPHLSRASHYLTLVYTPTCRTIRKGELPTVPTLSHSQLSQAGGALSLPHHRRACHSRDVGQWAGLAGRHLRPQQPHKPFQIITISSRVIKQRALNNVAKYWRAISSWRAYKHITPHHCYAAVALRLAHRHRTTRLSLSSASIARQRSCASQHLSLFILYRHRIALYAPLIDRATTSPCIAHHSHNACCFLLSLCAAADVARGINKRVKRRTRIATLFSNIALAAYVRCMAKSGAQHRPWRGIA